MAQPIVKSFIQALEQAELSTDIEPLVELFSDNAELVNTANNKIYHGQDGAFRFWNHYLSAFQSIHTEFTRIRGAKDYVTLEWRSRGMLSSGRKLEYSGVSILETEGMRIKRFRTYYDTASFLPHSMEKKAA